jgi:outer membrane lipoprotein SlyB
LHARFSFSPFLSIFLLSLSACGPSYSPDTYAPNAVQQANKVDQGTIVGVRDVGVSASGTLGAVSGGAAGGIAGAQVGSGPVSAFSALGGTLLGGLVGTATEHATADTKAFEYIVRKNNGDLVSVTQKDTVPLVVGQKVLVIAGNQARVVPDYTANAQPAGAKETAAAPAPPQAAPSPPRPSPPQPSTPPPSLPAPSLPAPDAINSPGNSSGVPDAGEQGAAHASGS